MADVQLSDLSHVIAAMSQDWRGTGSETLITATAALQAGGGGALEVEDEGISLSTTVTKLNFVGTGVTATEPISNEITVTIAGGAAPVDSVNGSTGIVVLDADDISDAATTNKYTTAADITKLAGIESNATADQTGAEIKSAYEAELDTNAFTDAQFTKLSGIESNATADQTGAEIKSAYEGEANAFTDAQFTKLSGIESNATADQTGAEIKSAYEAELDTNAFTDAQFTKLSGIESNATADQTGAEIKSAYEAELDTNAFDDAAVSKLAGIESNATADQTGAEIKSAYEAEANAFTDAQFTKLAGISAGATLGVATQDEGGSIDTTATTLNFIGAGVTATDAGSGVTNVTIAGGSAPVASVNTQTGAVVLDADDISDSATTNKYTTAADITKLSGIESNATADQTGAEIKSAYEAEANAFTDAQFTKLSGIESNATADQTGAEIKSAYEAELDTNAFDDAAVSKLAGISAGAEINEVTLTGTEALTNKTLTTPVLTLNQSATPTPTAEGDIQWDTDNNRITVGDGASTKVFSADSDLLITESQISDLGSYITESSTTTLTNKTFDANGVGNSISNVDLAADVIGNLSTGNLDSGTGANSSTFWRGDGTWSVPTGGGDVSKVGTPVDNQIGVWTGDGTIEGTTGLTYTGAVFDITGNITLTGTLDGRDIAADGTKLDGIESNATADQTGAEIKSAYEGEANAFTDAQFTKLAGIESNATADQTGAEIKSAYEAEGNNVNNQTGTSYTLVIGDVSTMITMDNAGSNTLTIPTNASVSFPIGTVVTVTQLGAGVTTIEGDTGVILTGNGGSVSAGSTNIQTRYNGVSLVKIATDRWSIGGDIGTVS